MVSDWVYESNLSMSSHMLGHEHIHTIEAYYGHCDLTDLERGDGEVRERPPRSQRSQLT